MARPASKPKHARILSAVRSEPSPTRVSTQAASPHETISRSPSPDASLLSSPAPRTRDPSVRVSTPLAPTDSRSQPRPSTPLVSQNEGASPNSAVQEDTRVLIEVKDNKTFDGQGREVLVNIIHSHFEGPYTCWTSIADETLDSWWKMFKYRCVWDAGKFSEEFVFKAFSHEGGSHLRRALNKARKDKRRPKWIKQSIWEEMLAIWDKDEFKKKSDVNKRNRAVAEEKGIPPYRGGSVSTTVHKKRMTDLNKGKEPSPKEIYERCYKKKDDEYTENYDTLLEKKTQEAQDCEGPDLIDEDQLWIEATGGVKKGRILGMGSEAPSILKKTRYVRSATPLGACGQSEASESMRNDMIGSALSSMNKQFSQDMASLAEKLTNGQEQIRREVTALGETVALNREMVREEMATLQLYVDKSVDGVVTQTKVMTEEMKKGLQETLINSVLNYFSNKSSS